MFDIVEVGKNIELELKNSHVELPPNYSLSNAMKGAYFKLQQTVDKNKQPALKVCTPISIQEALMDMAIQGLDPMKDQCYFLVYGTTLQCQRSYHGDQAVAMRVNPKIADIVATVVYRGDKFKFKLVNGRKVGIEHEQSLAEMDEGDIIGAYAVAISHEDEPLYTDIMTMREIKASWRQTKAQIFLSNGDVKPDSVQGKFPVKMVTKTVIKRMCKKIINISDDAVLLQAVQKTDEDYDNGDVIDIKAAEKNSSKPLDFKEQNQIEAPPVRVDLSPATRQQFDIIVTLSKERNQTTKDLMADLSQFVGRNIEKVSHVTEDEAKEYIEAIQGQLAAIRQPKPEDDENDSPDWG